MSTILIFLRDRRGASAAEFALVLPVFLLFLLGIIDLGRYAWEFNQAEKATQIGARWAVATNTIPGGTTDTGLMKYSFAVNGSIPQGTVVNSTAFPGVFCQTTATASATTDGPLVCSCKGTCGFTYAASDVSATDAWTATVNRMKQIYPRVTADNVRIDYDWSGLGFSGDPNGPDVAPLVTVSLRTDANARVEFEPMFLGSLGLTFSIPSASYTLTLEDGQGTDSN